MELVYLWVEDYKNIKRQGFNFSPKFECKFKDKYEIDTNGNEKLKDNCELIIKPKEHIDNFFGKNINITAIVGENGSGKSTTLSFIFNNIQEDYMPLGVKNYIFIVVINTKEYIFTTINTSHSKNTLIPKNFKEPIQEELRRKIFTSLYDYKISSNSLMYDKNNIRNSYPNKNLNSERITSEDTKFIYYHILFEDSQKYFSNYFTPTEILIKANNFYYHPRINKNNGKEFQDISRMADELGKQKDSLVDFLFIIYAYLGRSLFEAFKDNFSMSIIEEVEDLQTFRNTIHYILDELEHFFKEERKRNREYPNQESYLSELKKVFDYSEEIKNNENNFYEIFDTKTYNNLYNGMTLKANKLKLKEIGFSYILEKLPKCFDISFQDVKKNLQYEDLSSGEKSALRIRYYIEHIIKKNNNDNFLFLLDEPENDLHPQWQKELLHYLVNIFKERDVYIHFLITSHSPFILSDLPKENVIFLKNGKQDKPDIQETFGANIHTLLSHGFFMEDGLMGEFAKEKINEIIEILKKERLSDDEIKNCKNIISIIGEPILQKTLQHQLNEKLNPNETELEKLEREQEEIQEKINRLKKKDDETN